MEVLNKFKNKKEGRRPVETNKRGEKIRIAPFRELSTQLANKYVKKDVINRIDRGIKTVGGVDIDIPGTTGGIKMLFFTARNVYEYFAALITYAMFTLNVYACGVFVWHDGRSKSRRPPFDRLCSNRLCGAALQETAQGIQSQV